jgi:hypothetical protein
MRKLLFNFFSIHILKLEISGCDKVPAQSSRDNALPSNGRAAGRVPGNLRSQWSGPDDVAFPHDLRQAPPSDGEHPREGDDSERCSSPLASLL